MLTVTAVISDKARHVRNTHFAANLAAVSVRLGIIAGATPAIDIGSDDGMLVVADEETGFVAFAAALTAGGSVAGVGVATNELGDTVKAVVVASWLWRKFLVVFLILTPRE